MLVDPVAIKQSKKLTSYFFGNPKTEGLLEMDVENGLILMLAEKEVDGRLFQRLMTGRISLKE